MEITQEMIDDCVNDTSRNGKYQQLFEMLNDSVLSNISDSRWRSIRGVLESMEIDTSEMSYPEILFHYSKL